MSLCSAYLSQPVFSLCVSRRNCILTTHTHRQSPNLTRLTVIRLLHANSTSHFLYPPTAELRALCKKPTPTLSNSCTGLSTCLSAVGQRRFSESLYSCTFTDTGVEMSKAVVECARADSGQQRGWCMRKDFTAERVHERVRKALADGRTIADNRAQILPDCLVRLQHISHTAMPKSTNLLLSQ